MSNAFAISCGIVTLRLCPISQTFISNRTTTLNTKLDYAWIILKYKRNLRLYRERLDEAKTKELGNEMQTLVNPCPPVSTRVTRKNVTITLKPELVEKAHQLGLNISKIAETALENLVTTLQGSLPQEKARKWWAGRDLNSRPSACQADVLTKLDDRPNRS